MVAISTIRAEVESALNATTQGRVEPIETAGFLDTVSPMSFRSTAVPRGRMYAEAWVVDKAGEPILCVWRGYLATSGGQVAGPSSTPGMWVEKGWGIRTVVTQTGRGAATLVGFRCLVGSEADNVSGFIHAEEPGSGAGELVRVSITSPAAGADFGAQTAPDKVRWRLRGFTGRLAADATVSDRIFHVIVDNGASDIVSATIGAPLTASTTTVVTGAAESGLMTTRRNRTSFPLPLVTMLPTWRVRFSTEGMAAADQWDSGALHAEEWAVPA